MFHKWISSDGSEGMSCDQCLACGVCVETPDSADRLVVIAIGDLRSIVPCVPSDGPSHHFQYSGTDDRGLDYGECAYCGLVQDGDTLSGDYLPDCI